jgi:hypothetical protein
VIKKRVKILSFIKQIKKVEGYVDAIVAGDEYIDQQKTVFTRVNFPGDGQWLKWFAVYGDY